MKEAGTAHVHSPGFLRLVQEAKTRVKEFSIDQFLAKLRAGERFVLLDVREESEWAAGHLPGANHMSRGILERDIESELPEKDTPIMLYCGGGFRSALGAESLQKMGYTDVATLDGGWREWTARGLPTVKPEATR